jgi:hypothetical protein
MSGINPVYSGAANVTARLGSGVNIHEMVQLMQLERHGLLEKEMTGQLDEMKKRNAWLADAGAQLAKLRAMTHPAADSRTGDLGQPMRDWLKNNGIQFPGGNGNITGNELDQVVTNLKAAIDQVNTQSQTDMVRMQALNDKDKNCIEMMSSDESRHNEIMRGIIQKMG